MPRPVLGSSMQSALEHRETRSDHQHAEVCRLLEELRVLQMSIVAKLEAHVSIMPGAKPSVAVTESELTQVGTASALLEKSDAELDFEERQKVLLLKKDFREAEEQRIQAEDGDDGNDWAEKHMSKGILKQIKEDSGAPARPGKSWFESPRAFVEGPVNYFMVCVLIVNAIIIFLQSEYLGMLARVSLHDDVQTQDNLLTALAWNTDLFQTLDFTFNMLYFLELIARIVVLRYEWLFNKYTGKLQRSNLFEGIVVTVGLLDGIMSSTLQASGVQLLKLLRFLKIVRTGKMIRVLAFFSRLRALWLACEASTSALFWSMVMVITLVVLAGLYLCQSTHEFVLDEANNLDDRELVFELYGSGIKASWSMFEATFSGSWVNNSRPLIRLVSGDFAIFFMIYTSVVSFAFLRIIGALLLKETLAVTQNDTIFTIQEQTRSGQKFESKIMEIFRAADESEDNSISRAEFHHALKDSTLSKYLSSLDIEVHEIDILFDLLDDGDGFVSVQEFVKGLPRLKGQARALDTITIIHDTRVIQQQLRELRRNVASLMPEM